MSCISSWCSHFALTATETVMLVVCLQIIWALQIFKGQTKIPLQGCPILTARMKRSLPIWLCSGTAATPVRQIRQTMNQPDLILWYFVRVEQALHHAEQSDMQLWTYQNKNKDSLIQILQKYKLLIHYVCHSCSTSCPYFLLF